MLFKNRFNKEAPPNMKAFAKTLLFEAVRDNDVSKAGQILSQYHSSISWEQGGELALNVAIAHGSFGVVHLFIRKGADPEKSDKMGFNALTSAARSLDLAGVMKIVDMLKPRGVDVNTCDAQGRTMLHVAVEKSKDDLVQALLQAGARIDVRDRDGKTALMKAVTRKNLQAVETLLDAGADLKIATAKGETALSMARALHATDPLYLAELEKVFQNTIDARYERLTAPINKGTTTTVRILPKIVIRKP